MTSEAYRAAACVGKKPVTVARIQVQECAEVYGQGACYATDPEPCDQTYKRCKARCAFNCRNVEYTHASCTTGQLGTAYDPNLTGPAEYNYGLVEFCKGLPQAATATLQFDDGPGCDYADPYLEQRSDFDAAGYRMARFDARHRLEGRQLLLDQGWCDVPYPAAFNRQRLFIDSFTGPSGDNCRWTMKAKDALSFLNDNAAKWPAAEAVTTLAFELEPDSTSLVVFDTPATNANATAFCINDEAILVEFANTVTMPITGELAYAFRIVERAICGSTLNAETVEVDTVVNYAAYWPKGTNVATVYFDLLTGAGGLPWFDQDCECGPFSTCVVDVQSFREFLNGCGKPYTIAETVICKPTGLRTIFDELAVFGAWPYLDDCDQKIKLHFYQPTWCDPATDLPTFYEQQLIDCRVDVRPKAAERFSTVEIYGNPQDCTKGVSSDNLQLLAQVSGNSGAGEVCGNPNWMPPRTREIRSRFLDRSNNFLANKLAQRIWYARRETPRQITFRIHPSNLPADLRKTSFFRVKHKKLDTVRTPSPIYWLQRMRPIGGNCWEIQAITSGFDENQRWRAAIRTCEGECASTITSVQNTACDVTTGCALTY